MNKQSDPLSTERGQEIIQKAAVSRKYQLVVITLVAIGFGFLSSMPEKILDVAATLYGGAVSLFYSWSLGYALQRASEIAKKDPSKGITFAAVSAAIRFVLLLGLLALGIGTLGLNPIPLLTAAILSGLVGVIAPHVIPEKKQPNS